VFTRHGHYIDVRVRNPVADPRRYRAEFRAHRLDITLKLVPASPSLVGTVVFFDGSSAIKVLTAKGRCRTGGGGDVCPVGLRVPVDYRGAANLVFGRAARPGERFETTASATAPGEALHGLRVRGLRVSAVLALLRGRHVTAPVFHVTTARGEGKLVSPGKVPGGLVRLRRRSLGTRPGDAVGGSEPPASAGAGAEPGGARAVTDIVAGGCGWRLSGRQCPPASLVTPGPAAMTGRAKKPRRAAWPRPPSWF